MTDQIKLNTLNVNHTLQYKQPVCTAGAGTSIIGTSAETVQEYHIPLQLSGRKKTVNTGPIQVQNLLLLDSCSNN
jgi:hypothetical protein